MSCNIMQNIFFSMAKALNGQNHFLSNSSLINLPQLPPPLEKSCKSFQWQQNSVYLQVLFVKPCTYTNAWLVKIHKLLIVMVLMYIFSFYWLLCNILTFTSVTVLSYCEVILQNGSFVQMRDPTKQAGILSRNLVQESCQATQIQTHTSAIEVFCKNS